MHLPKTLENGKRDIATLAPGIPNLWKSPRALRTCSKFNFRAAEKRASISFLQTPSRCGRHSRTALKALFYGQKWPCRFDIAKEINPASKINRLISRPGAAIFRCMLFLEAIFFPGIWSENGHTKGCNLDRKEEGRRCLLFLLFDTSSLRVREASE